MGCCRRLGQQVQLVDAESTNEHRVDSWIRISALASLIPIVVLGLYLLLR